MLTYNYGFILFLVLTVCQQLFSFVSTLILLKKNLLKLLKLQ